MKASAVNPEVVTLRVQAKVRPQWRQLNFFGCKKDIERAHALGVTHYVNKPISEEAMLRVLEA
jgi:hypothetical protein